MAIECSDCTNECSKYVLILTVTVKKKTGHKMTTSVTSMDNFFYRLTVGVCQCQSILINSILNIIKNSIHEP